MAVAPIEEPVEHESSYDRPPHILGEQRDGGAKAERTGHGEDGGCEGASRQQGLARMQR
jgi:hypothetical protein